MGLAARGKSDNFALLRRDVRAEIDKLREYIDSRTTPVTLAAALGISFGGGTGGGGALAPHAPTHAEGGGDTLLDDSITNKMLRNSAPLSVIGRPVFSSGDPSDIVAALNKSVLARDGTALGFHAVQSPLTLGGATLDFDEAVPLGNNARVEVEIADVSIGTRRAINFIAGSGIDLSGIDDAGGEEVDLTIATTGVAGVDAAYVTIGNDGSLTAERALTGSTSILVTDNGANSSVVLSLIDEYLDDRVAALLVEGHGIDLVYDDRAGSLTIAVDEGELDESLLDHGSLGGLGDDDHAQYLLAAGTRPLTGNWAVGNFNVTGIASLGAVTGTFTGSVTLNSSAPTLTIGDGTGFGGGNAIRVNKADGQNVNLFGAYSAAVLRWIQQFNTGQSLITRRLSSAGATVNNALTFNASDTLAGTATTLADAAITMAHSSVQVTLGAGADSPSEIFDADGTGTGTLSFLKDSANTSGKRLQHTTGEDLQLSSHDGSSWRDVASIENADHTWEFQRQWATPFTIYAPAGTTQTIDWNDGNMVQLGLFDASGDVTLTLSNPNDGAIYHIRVLEGASEIDVIWPGEVLWPGGIAPIITSGDGSVDLIKLVYDDGLGVYFGTFEQDFQ